MMAPRTLLETAQDAEDVAAGLRVFRDEIPRSAARITAAVSELYALSHILQAISQARADPRHEPSYYRIRDDLAIVLQSLRFSLGAAFDMFIRARDRSHQVVWDDFQHRMEDVEGHNFLERLECYKQLLHCDRDLLTGRRPRHDVRELRMDVGVLLDAQAISRRPRSPRLIESSGTFPLNS